MSTLVAASLATAALGWAPAFPTLLAFQPEAGEPAEAAQPGREAPDAEAPSEPQTDPEMDRIIEDLERAADRAADTRIAPPAPPTSAATANGANARLLREGSFLRSRRGRVVRDDGGDWVFRFDSDGESPIADTPMVLMPCQALMAMEAIAQRHGDAVTFTVSGEVFVYHNRNYLLPRMYLVNRATDEVLPAQ